MPTRSFPFESLPLNRPENVFFPLQRPRTGEGRVSFASDRTSSVAVLGVR